ncbi:MAG: hypothetical protein Q8O30_04210, partial [Candidatus Omnitrophota bacterium]|nr:hypothetical protein [Candidatus Omnitrophota bacterium]
YRVKRSDYYRINPEILCPETFSEKKRNLTYLFQPVCQRTNVNMTQPVKRGVCSGLPLDVARDPELVEGILSGVYIFLALKGEVCAPPNVSIRCFSLCVSKLLIS